MTVTGWNRKAKLVGEKEKQNNWEEAKQDRESTNPTKEYNKQNKWRVWMDMALIRRLTDKKI